MLYKVSNGRAIQFTGNNNSARNGGVSAALQCYVEKDKYTPPDDDNRPDNRQKRPKKDKKLIANPCIKTTHLMGQYLAKYTEITSFSACQAKCEETESCDALIFIPSDGFCVNKKGGYFPKSDDRGVGRNRNRRGIGDGTYLYAALLSCLQNGEGASEDTDGGNEVATDGDSDSEDDGNEAETDLCCKNKVLRGTILGKPSQKVHTFGECKKACEEFSGCDGLSYIKLKSQCMLFKNSRLNRPSTAKSALLSCYKGGRTVPDPEDDDDDSEEGGECTEVQGKGWKRGLLKWVRDTSKKVRVIRSFSLTQITFLSYTNCYHLLV